MITRELFAGQLRTGLEKLQVKRCRVRGTCTSDQPFGG
jgi:hypothetical protein